MLQCYTCPGRYVPGSLSVRFRVLRTIHGYLFRELLRVTILALVAFTLVMTVFAIMEPLRKQGLATGQVAMLFVFTLPVMLSLTLPFAALFAAAIIYGRFAQDREMLACRAGGISAITILQPAIALGLAVTIISLILTNFVSPQMAKHGEEAVMKNIKRIAYHLIKKESHVRFGSGNKYIVHATHVDEKNDALIGVVAGQYVQQKDPKTGAVVDTIEVLVASRAFLNIVYDDASDRHYASVAFENPAGPISPQTSGIVSSEEGSMTNIEMPNPSEDKTSFYDWKKLLRTLEDPTLFGEIHRKMQDIKRDVRLNRVVTELAETIQSGVPYRKLRRDDELIEITAAHATVERNVAKLGFGTGKDGLKQPVKVRVLKGNQEKVYTADHGIVDAGWNNVSRKSYVTIKLSGNVRLPVDRAMTGEAPRRPDWIRGQIPLPDDPMMPETKDPKSRYQEERKLISAIYRDPRQFTSDPNILAKIDMIKTYRAPKVRGEVIAEMHARIAFGVSCVLLVALGAALGIIFKGGQVLIAFTISVLPAAGNIVMILMGKKMISNPKSSDLIGMATIWGGVVIILIADVIIYYRLSRK